MNTIKNVSLLLFCLIALSSAISAQTTHTQKEYERKPLWIDMIKDPAVNYFEAKKAFDLFWKNKPLPTEEDEIIGEKNGTGEKRNSFLKELFKSKKERKEEESQKYAFDYKKFKQWERLAFPYIQADGKILSQDEKLKLWQESRQK